MPVSVDDAGAGRVFAAGKCGHRRGIFDGTGGAVSASGVRIILYLLFRCESSSGSRACVEGAGSSELSVYADIDDAAWRAHHGASQSACAESACGTDAYDLPVHFYHVGYTQPDEEFGGIETGLCGF